MAEVDQSHLLPYARRADFKVARASELTGKDRRFYRFLEIVPGIASWGFLIGLVLASIYASFFAAYFIIAFAVFWLLKTIFLSYHVRHNWKRLKHHMELDWEQLVGRFCYDHFYHLVIFPFYEEPKEVLEGALKGLLEAKYDPKKMIVVLAAEGRAGKDAENLAREMERKYAGKFGHFMVTVHPADLPGELAGKGSNTHHALHQVREQIIDKHQIPYKNVITSIFDVDTVIYPDYFNCLIWHFMTVENPYKSAFQPVPLFTNNLWDAPALSRVMAMSSTFWQMIMQERPEKAATFSSHSVSFQALYEIGYGQANVVSEDSRIYWNLLVANNGDFEVVSLSYPIAMDATVAPTLRGTIKNIYKQHRRWTYGVENWCYIVYHFVKNKDIPLKKRWAIGLLQGEGYWSLATYPLVLFILGWAPIYLGPPDFHQTLLSFELPIMVRNLLILAMGGLVLSSIISLSLTPPRPAHHSRFRYVVMAVQWIMVPITMVVFSAIPGLDSQTRLLFGKYMGFWVTPKRQKN
ncbi:MAG: glycosyltransferase family 2 protein [Candidatus Kaiserbacteria bacterium]|nr:glycosyltransferase family 2 protein [Candidatus Kaiserbacteria bacterium]MCB9816250.1 glycosyltransferase family 2 protein [Candidatus Nomurabacteria bacterium]